MASSSWTSYRTALHSCYKALISYGLPTTLPLQPATVALYLSHLHHEKGNSPNTLSSHTSAIAFIHKLLGLTDPTESFLVKKVLQGAKNCNPCCDLRLPITLPILYRLVDSIDHICTTPWDRLLYRSMYLLAFFAFLRVGEMTGTPQAGTHTLSVSSIKAVPGTTSLSLTFSHYKHSKKPATITVEPQAVARYCPVRAWNAYLALRGSTPGPMFIRHTRQPVSRHAFASQLALSLQACHLSPTLYKSHSFRIGAATYAAESKHSALQIQAMGRWNSNAFLKYIRF